MTWYRWDGADLLLELRVQPRASQDGFGEALNDRLKLRHGGVWSERPVQPGDEWERTLRHWFDMTP